MIDGTTPVPHASAVSWAAILAGAAGAAALSLVLLMLGTGLGLSAVSPWATQGVAAKALGVSAILWLSFTQLAASGLGGYLAGRLRLRWLNTDGDEVYFRDTTHGFLAWAVATLLTAATLTSAVGAIVGGGAQAGATVAAGAVAAAGAATPEMARQDKTSGADSTASYFVDTLFRRGAPTTAGPTTAAPSPVALSPDDTARSTAEAARIFATSLANGALTPDDKRYLGQVVAQRTGLPQSDAESRVADTFSRLQAKVKERETTAREVADKARKATAYASLWIVVSLLVGAFVASWAATWGGRRRDLF